MMVKKYIPVSSDIGSLGGLYLSFNRRGQYLDRVWFSNGTTRDFEVGIEYDGHDAERHTIVASKFRIVICPLVLYEVEKTKFFILVEKDGASGSVKGTFDLAAALKERVSNR